MYDRNMMYLVKDVFDILLAMLYNLFTFLLVKLPIYLTLYDNAFMVRCSPYSSNLIDVLLDKRVLK